jgi:hypothetical protein
VFPVEDDEPVLRPPLPLLAGGAVAVAASAVLLAWSGRIVDLVGYLLATVVTVVCVAGFRSLDSRRRSRPTYVVPPLAQRIPPSTVAWAVLVAGVAVGAVHVWRFAQEVAR